MSQLAKYKSALLVMGGALAGSSLTYILTEKIIQKKYADISDEEIRSVKESYHKLREQDKEHEEEHIPETVVVVEEEKTVLDSYEDRVGKLQYNKVKEVEVLTAAEREALKPTLRDVAIPNPDPEIKTPQRIEGMAYVITLAEFEEENLGFEKSTISYYPEDDSLVDERDELFPDHKQIVGPDALLFFGHYSGDDHIVHVRNPRLDTDFEVTLENGTYAENVLGLPNGEVGV